MAKLIFEDGREATAADLTSLATAHGIVVEHREVPAELAPLLQRPLLDDDATREVLAALPLRPELPSRDLVVLHPQRKDNEQLATKFEDWHRHAGERFATSSTAQACSVSSLTATAPICLSSRATSSWCRPGSSTTSG